MTPKDYHLFMSYIKRCKNTNTLNGFSKAIKDRLAKLLENRFKKVLELSDGSLDQKFRAAGFYSGDGQIDDYQIDEIDTNNSTMYIGLLYRGNDQVLHLLSKIIVTDTDLNKYNLI